MSGLIAGVMTNPFPGLRPFVEGEELLFFGRESQVDRMVDKLAANRFLAVVGTSGSGKSSLVNCGLKPALHRGVMASAGASWCMVQMRPGGRPIHAMAEAFAANEEFFATLNPESMTLTEMAELSLSMSSLGLVDFVRTARLKPGTNLLLVVDQFEELFRYSAASRPGEAIEFVNLLLEARAQTKFPIYIVLTMRSDFLGECSQFDRLPEVINEGQYLIPRLTRDERRRAICGPIEVAGEQLSPVLLTRLVNDVGEEPDQLSILQHAINRTWAFWQKNGGIGEISLEDYENKTVGTMDAALDLHAEEAYGKLTTPAQQRLCEKVFKALTDKGTDARGIRRPMKLGTLCAVCGATQEAVLPVLAVFRDPEQSFLMPPLAESVDSKSVIDISHEVLMRVWKRLKVWTEEEAKAADMYRRVADDAERYAQQEAALWRDPNLQNALKWKANQEPNAAWGTLYRPRADFQQAMQFLEAGKKVRDQEKAEVEFQRRFRKLRPAMLVTVGVVLVVVTLFIQARFSNRIAQGITAGENWFSRAKLNEAKPGEVEANLLLDSLKVEVPAAGSREEALEATGVERSGGAVQTPPPGEPDQALQAAIKELRSSSGSLESAEADLEDVLRRDPRNTDALLARAYIRMKQANFSAAMADLQNASLYGSHNPALEGAWDASRFWSAMQQGEASVQAHDTQGAQRFENYAKFVATRGTAAPLNAEALEHLGTFLVQSGDYREAAQVYAKLAALKPTDHDVLLYLFVAKVASGDLSGGLAVQKSIDDLWSQLFVMSWEQTIADMVCFVFSATLCSVFYWQFWVQTERLYRRRIFTSIFEEVSAPEKKVVPVPVAAVEVIACKPATVGRLLGAGVIDFFLLLIMQSVGEYVLAVKLGNRAMAPDSTETLTALYLLLAFLMVPLTACLYSSVLAWSRFGGTVGDRAGGIRLVDLTGHKPGFRRLLGRYAFAAFTCILIVGFLGVLMELITKRRRSLADLVAGTQYVLREKKAPAALAPDSTPMLPPPHPETGMQAAA